MNVRCCDVTSESSFDNYRIHLAVEGYEIKKLWRLIVVTSIDGIVLSTQSKSKDQQQLVA